MAVPSIEVPRDFYHNDHNDRNDRNDRNKSLDDACAPRIVPLHAIIKFMSGDIHIIKTWNGFSMGNLITNIKDIMEKEYKEKDFNCERILFYNYENEHIEFMDDDILNNGDYFNIVIKD
jgi:hypothetical protein